MWALLPTITTAALPVGMQNVAYNSALTATGGSGTGYSFSTSDTLPAGITLSSSGIISGTTTAIGSVTFTVTVTDSLNRSSTKSFTITITGARLYAATSPGFTSGACDSWSTACELRYAMAISTPGTVSGQEIWVKAGIYKPTATTTDRDATFTLNDKVAVYGGFAGTETDRDQRDFVNNVTILSGDIDNNDSQKPVITSLDTVTGNDTNSYHVVTGANGAILDGVTITGGLSDSGLFAGGGMFNDMGSSPTITNVTFSGNLASSMGGGMFNDFYSSPSLTNVTFSGNRAINGGGMYNIHYSSPSLTNVTFSGNPAFEGGGMFNNDNCNPILTNVTFAGNSAKYDGGGMYNKSTSSPSLTNATFSDNSSENGNGGGMFNDSASSPTITNATFSGNSAAKGTGGCMSNNAASCPKVTNATFSGNSAKNGGAIYNSWSSNPVLTNVTVSRNSASVNIGGLFDDLYSSSTIRNSILWDDIGGEIEIENSSPTITNSVVQGGYDYGMNIIIGNPLLGPLGNYGGPTQTIPLLPGSPAINAGDQTKCTDSATLDQRGMPRVGTCDIGAFEYQGLTNLLAIAITGATGNKVESTSPDQRINCIKGSSGGCSANYASGETVLLNPTATSGSGFSGWSGAVNSTDDPLSIIMNGNKNLTAAFDLIPVAKNKTSGVSYTKLSDALGAASGGDEVRLLDTSFSGAMSLGKGFILSGGWNNTFDAPGSLSTTLSDGLTVTSGNSKASNITVGSKLTIRSGSLRVDGVKVK
jgi:hypothetical protein